MPPTLAAIQAGVALGSPAGHRSSRRLAPAAPQVLTLRAAWAKPQSHGPHRERSLQSYEHGCDETDDAGSGSNCRRIRHGMTIRPDRRQPKDAAKDHESDCIDFPSHRYAAFVVQHDRWRSSWCPPSGQSWWTGSDPGTAPARSTTMTAWKRQDIRPVARPE